MVGGKIDDLLNGNSGDFSMLLKPKKTGNIEDVKSINLADIIPDPNQVRRSENIGFSEEDNDEVTNLSDLIASIKSIGVRQPIILRKNPSSDKDAPPYMIVSGERRYRASLKAGLDKIPAIIREYEDEYDVKYDQITENIQRVDLTNFDIAFFIQALKDNYQKQYNKKLQNQQIAKLLGKSQKWVTEVSVFADCPSELLPYFKDGTVAPSLRLGYELINAWNREPKIVAEWFNDARQTTGHIDRTLTATLPDYIAMKKGIVKLKTDSEQQEIQVPDNDDFSESTEDLDENDAETANTIENGQNEETASEEYSELNEREKSAVPKMAPAVQQRSDHTAGLGKPDFTDRDTRTGHDLSDRIKESNNDSFNDEDDTVDDYSNDSATGRSEKIMPNNQQHMLGFSHIACTYNDPDDEENSGDYILDLTVVCSKKEFGHIYNKEKDLAMDVPLYKLTLLQIVE